MEISGTVGRAFFATSRVQCPWRKIRNFKPLTDAIVCGPVSIADWKEDMRLAREVIDKDYSDRFLIPRKENRNRSILDPERSLGSVIKLLTPSQSLYTEILING